MALLGKPLVFYLKYMPEMNRLYSNQEDGLLEKLDLSGLDQPEHAIEMARAVGAVASEEAADFLGTCAKEIERHFRGLAIATIGRSRKRPFVLRHWFWEARIDVPSVPKGQFWCGVHLTAPPEVSAPVDCDSCGVVIPYIWSKGGQSGGEAVSRILKGLLLSRKGEGYVHESATVALAAIPIKPQPPNSFDVVREPLVAAVIEKIARIGVKETKAIAKFVAGLNEIDED